MIPVRIGITGFMSYEKTQVLDFSGDSLWVLTGKNGVGKSTVFDAMAFALFGEPRAGNISDLVNHKSDRAEIVFDFLVGSNQYRVRRTITSAGHTTRQAIQLLPQPGDRPKEMPIPGTDKMAEFDRWVEKEVGLNPAVFKTAVLLSQGKADALLTANTETRYDVLSKLIDLSRYEALAAKAKENRNHWNGLRDGYLENLRRIEAITDEDIAEAKRKIELETTATAAAGKRMGELTALYGQSKTWEGLIANLHNGRERRDILQKLIEQAAEITRGYHRLSELRTVLPELRTTWHTLDKIASTRGTIERLESEEAAYTEPLHLSTASRDRLVDQVRDLHGQMKAQLTASRRAAEQLDPLKTTINQLEEISRIEGHVADYQDELSSYPPDLDEQLVAARKECEELADAASASPHLTRLLDDIDELRRASAALQGADQKITALEAKRPDLEQDKEAAAKVALDTETATRAAGINLAQAQARQSEADERHKRFEEVEELPVCRYCGQEMSEEHKARERIELAKDLEHWKGEVARLERRSGDAAAAQKSAASRLKSADDAITSLVSALKNASGAKAAADNEIRRLQHSLILSYRALPTNYQVRVSPNEPAAVSAWLATTYPVPSDLAQANSEGNALGGKKKKVARLEEQQSNQRTTQRLLAEKQKELMVAQSHLPYGWEQSQDEYARISAVKSQADAAYQKTQESQEQAEKDRDQAIAEVNRLTQQQVNTHAKLQANRTSLTVDEGALQSQLNKLPEAWRAEAVKITSERLDELDSEQKGLLGYEHKHQDLLAANSNLVEVEGNITRFEAEIASLPVDARQPSEQVNQALKVAQDSAREADRRQLDAEKSLVRLQEQQALYAETEQRWKEADRMTHLYGILAEQFSERGIQRMLVRRAEHGIVRLGNELLDNLTGGRSQLRLREEGGNRKALDLEIWDTITGGGKPLLVGLASGSQKFRVAIALALAIGQYIGRESHHVESVVIDEGFGSLDTEGREAVIQELHNLRQHLKRILLVSHQEEFSRGFTTGYRILLTDGASEVRLLNN